MTAPERPLHLAVDRSTVDLTADDRVLARALAAAGVPVVPTIWGERLAAGRRILIRSTWDYVAQLPRAGEWRVQSEFGGTAERIDLTAEMNSTATAALAHLGAAPTYARIDMVRLHGTWQHGCCHSEHWSTGDSWSPDRLSSTAGDSPAGAHGVARHTASPADRPVWTSVAIGAASSRRSMSGVEGSDRTAPAVVVASAPAAAA